MTRIFAIYQEETVGWYECLLEAFQSIDDIEFCGEIVRYEGLVVQGNQVLVKIKYNKNIAKVSLDSIKILESPKYVKKWIEAYLKYRL